MLACRLMIPKQAWEMAKNSMRSGHVGKQKHRARYLCTCKDGIRGTPKDKIGHVKRDLNPESQSNNSCAALITRQQDTKRTM